MAAASADQLKQLLKDPDNSRCFDCSRPGTQWASVSHGIYICLECSGQHRGLGVHISFVKSITMDAWYTLSRTPVQLRMMICGGNKRLKEFFRSYQYPVTMTIQAKYSTRAAQFYRSMIKCEAEGKLVEALPPALEDGLTTIEGTDHLFRAPKPMSSVSSESSRPDTPPQEPAQSSVGSWWSSAKSALTGAYSKASDVTSTAIEKVKEAGVMDTVKSAASSVYDTSKNIGSAIVEKGREVAVTFTQQSDSVKSVTSRIGEMSQKALEGASSAIGRIRGSGPGDEEEKEPLETETLEELMRRDRERMDRQENSTGERFDPLQASRPLGARKTDKIE